MWVVFVRFEWRWGNGFILYVLSLSLSPSLSVSDLTKWSDSCCLQCWTRCPSGPSRDTGPSCPATSGRPPSPSWSTSSSGTAGTRGSQYTGQWLFWKMFVIFSIWALLGPAITGPGGVRGLLMIFPSKWSHSRVWLFIIMTSSFSPVPCTPAAVKTQNWKVGKKLIY